MIQAVQAGIAGAIPAGTLAESLLKG